MASQDMKAAERSYSSFITMVKISVPLIALIAAIVVVIISN